MIAAFVAVWILGLQPMPESPKPVTYELIDFELGVKETGTATVALKGFREDDKLNIFTSTTIAFPDDAIGQELTIKDGNALMDLLIANKQEVGDIQPHALYLTYSTFDPEASRRDILPIGWMPERREVRYVYLDVRQIPFEKLPETSITFTPPKKKREPGLSILLTGQ